MKERILKIIMILIFIVSAVVFLNGINLTIQEISAFYEGLGFRGAGLGWIVISSVLISVSGLIQYIIIEKFNPFYLFRS